MGKLLGLTLLKFALFVLTFSVLAKETVHFQVKIYDLPSGNTADLSMNELIELSELTHQPSLLAELNKEARVVIGTEEQHMLEITLSSDIRTGSYSIKLSQKEKKDKKWNEMGYSIPEVSLGKESYSIVNTGKRHRLFHFNATKVDMPPIPISTNK